MRRATERAQGAEYGNPQVRTRRRRDRLGPTDGPTRLDGRIRGHALASDRRRRPEIPGQVAQRGCHDGGAGKLAQRATALEHPPTVLITIHPERFSSAAQRQRRESGAGERDPSGPCTSCAGAPNAKGRQRCRVSMRERLRPIRTGSRCCGRFSVLPRCARASDRKRTRSWRAMKAVPSPGWRRASARPWCTSGGAPPTRERGYTISGWLARGGWLGPPVEVCPETELIAIEASATVCDDALQIGEGLEVLVCERLVEDGPGGLRGLEPGAGRG